jgi:hypothetical protein
MNIITEYLFMTSDGKAIFTVGKIVGQKTEIPIMPIYNSNILVPIPEDLELPSLKCQIIVPDKKNFYLWRFAWGIFR